MEEIAARVVEPDRVKWHVNVPSEFSVLLL